jgi:Lon protease-like protein
VTCQATEAMPMTLPIFPLNTVLFPGVRMPLRIFEERYLRMLADRTPNDPAFAISLIVSGREAGDTPVFHEVGTTARLVSIDALSAHRVDIVVVGDRRIRISSADWTRGYAVAETGDLPDSPVDRRETAGLAIDAHQAYAAYVRGIARLVEMRFSVPVISLDTAVASYELASRLPLHTWEQQAILENADPRARMHGVQSLLDRELALLFKGGVAGVPLFSPGDRFTLN